MITIVYDNNHIDIDLSAIFDLPQIDEKDARFRRDDLKSVANRGTYIQVNFASESKPYQCNLDGSNEMMPISSVNGVSVTDIDHLHELLKAMIS